MASIRRIMAVHHGKPTGVLLGLAVTLLVPSLRAEVVQGRITQCSGTALPPPGYNVAVFQSMLVGTQVNDGGCQGPFTLKERVLVSTTTAADGTFRINISPSKLVLPPKCISENMVFIELSTPEGTFLRRSGKHDVATTTTTTTIDIGNFDTLEPAGNCPQPRFIFSFDGPSEVSGLPGTTISFEATVLLDAEFEGRPALHGAEGWIVNVAAEGGTVLSATKAGTLAAKVDDDPPGLVCGNGGVSVDLKTTTAGPECANLRVVQSSAVLCMTELVGLPLEGALPSILRITVEAVMPAQGAQGLCRLFFPENCFVVSQPLRNAGVFQGESIAPLEKRELVVTLRGESTSTLFRRADVNGSADVDISDAVSTLSWLFSGTEDPTCLAAADSNDSGGVDLSDAVYTLNWLFSSGERPPSPGPFECGSDATPDELPPCSGTGC